MHNVELRKALNQWILEEGELTSGGVVPVFYIKPVDLESVFAILKEAGEFPKDLLAYELERTLIVTYLFEGVAVRLALGPISEGKKLKTPSGRGRFPQFTGREVELGELFGIDFVSAEGADDEAEKGLQYGVEGFPLRKGYKWTLSDKKSV